MTDRLRAMVLSRTVYRKCQICNCHRKGEDMLNTICGFCCLFVLVYIFSDMDTEPNTQNKSKLPFLHSLRKICKVKELLQVGGVEWYVCILDITFLTIIKVLHRSFVISRKCTSLIRYQGNIGLLFWLLFITLWYSKNL